MYSSFFVLSLSWEIQIYSGVLVYTCQMRNLMKQFLTLFLNKHNIMSEELLCHLVFGAKFRLTFVM